MTNLTDKSNAKSKPARASAATKKNQLIKLLGTKTGSDIKTLSEKLGWQQHTTRAALSGLRKEGHELVSAKPAKGGLSKYRIAPVPDQPASVGTSTHGS